MSATPPAGFSAIGPLADFPPGSARAVRLGGERVAVFNVAGRLYALQDACPHMGASLAEGSVCDGRVTCSWHARSFELASGASDSRTGAAARVYEVRVEADVVYLRRPAEPAAADSEPEPPDPWVRFDPDKHLKGRRG